MNIPGLVIQMEAWSREELAAQKALLALLDRQEQAVSKNDTEELTAVSEEVQAHLKKNTGRDRRRQELVGRLATAFGVSAKTLTLESIAQRASDLGIPTDGLLASREELRKESAKVLRTGRRIASIARYHQAFLNEVLRIFAPDDDEAKEPVLLDARA